MFYELTDKGSDVYLGLLKMRPPRRRGVIGRVIAFLAGDPGSIPGMAINLIPTLGLQWGPLSFMRKTE